MEGKTWVDLAEHLFVGIKWVMIFGSFFAFASLFTGRLAKHLAELGIPRQTEWLRFFMSFYVATSWFVDFLLKDSEGIKSLKK